MKKCFKCGATKPLSEFYRHPMMNDGHLNKCKGCTKADVNQNRTAKIDYYREYDRARTDDPARVALRKKVAAQRRNDPEKRSRDLGSSKAWAERNSDKRAAHNAVNNAVRDGKLKAKPCETCGYGVGVQAHHEDYSKPLDVIWLCKRCHGARHREINEERRSA